MYVTAPLFENSRFAMNFRKIMKNLHFRLIFEKSRYKSNSLKNLDFGQPYRKITLAVIIFENFRFDTNYKKTSENLDFSKKFR